MTRVLIVNLGPGYLKIDSKDPTPGKDPKEYGAAQIAPGGHVDLFVNEYQHLVLKQTP